jgi:hypothetical protein
MEVIMSTVYYVRNKRTRELLNQKGTWSQDFGSYRLASFDTETAAEASFPPGIECSVIKRERKDQDK